MHGETVEGRRWFARAYLVQFSLAFVGIAILRFWYQYNLYNLHFTTDYGIGVAWTNILRAGVIGILLACSALPGVARRVPRGLLVWGSLVLMSASSIFNFWELVTGDVSLEVARYVTCGIGLVWGGGMWMDFFSRLRPAYAFLYLLAGLALSCLLSLVCGYVPAYTMGLVNLFVPALAVLSFWGAMHALDERAPHGAPLDPGALPSGIWARTPAVERARRVAARSGDPYDGANRGRLAQVVAAYFVFTLVLGIALGFPDGVPRELPQLARSIHQLAIVAVLACVAVWVCARCRRFRFPTVWCFLNALLALAIVLLVTDEPGPRILATSLMLMAESFFYSFCFLTAYDIGRHVGRSPMTVLGVMYGGTLLCMGMGRLLSFRIAELPGGDLAMAVVMSVLVVVELLLALRPTMFDHGLPLFAEIAQDAQALRREAWGAVSAGGAAMFGPARGDAAVGLGEDVPAGGGSASTALFEERCRTWGLTDVEARIAALIAHGRSRAVIARELGYAENTIRNYTRSLYRKAGVASKQELIDRLSEGPSSHVGQGEQRP